VHLVRLNGLVPALVGAPAAISRSSSGTNTTAASTISGASRAHHVLARRYWRTGCRRTPWVVAAVEHDADQHRPESP